LNDKHLHETSPRILYETKRKPLVEQLISGLRLWISQAKETRELFWYSNRTFNINVMMYSKYRICYIFQGCFV